MNKFLLTTALIAMTALTACKKDSDVADTAPAAGEETTMSAPVDATVDTTVTTDSAESAPVDVTTPSEPVVTPEGTTAEGVAVGEPNPATPAAEAPTCGDHADLVGKNVADIDTATVATDVRVVKPGDAVTMDHNPARVNINTDDAGVVTSVTCG